MSKKGILICPADMHQCDWAIKAKELHLNTLGIHSGGGPNHDVVQALGNTALEPFRNHVTKDAGLELEYECHVTGTVLPETLFAKHPEYFQTVFSTGHRIQSGSWCITNPDVAGLLKNQICQLTQKLPSTTHRYFYWTADQPMAWCHCPSCSQYTMSEQNLLAMNTMLEGITEIDPLAELAFLAYHNTISVPRKIIPANGIFLEFAPYPRCYCHAINDPNCEINRKYWNALKQLLEIFSPRRAQILEYWLDVSYFSSYREPKVKPPISRDLLKRDLEAYLSLGIRNFTTFAVFMDGDFLHKEGDEELIMYAETLNDFLDD